MVPSGADRPAIEGSDRGEPAPGTAAAGVELNVSPDRSTGLGNSPGEWPAGDRSPIRPTDRRNGSVRSEFDLDSPILGSSAGANRSVYVGLGNGFLYAFEAGSDRRLRVRWQLYFEAELTVGPTVREGTAYVGTNVGLTPDTNARYEGRNVYAIDTATGEIRWERELSAPASSLVARGETLYIGDRDGGLRAIETAGSDSRWRRDFGDSVLLSAPPSGERIYATTANGTVAALDAGTGAVAWNRSLATALESAPVAADGRVYLAAARGRVLALNATTGATVWTRSVAGAVHAPPAVANGSVYVGTQNGSVYALNASTGAVVWRRSAGGPVFAAPVATRGVVYAGVAGDSGGLVALDAATGDQAWRFDTAGAVFASPAVTEEGIVVTDYAGRIYLVERA